MATFEVVDKQGLKIVKCVIQNELVRAEAGALHYSRGAIEMTSSVPSATGFLKSMVTGETIFRPTYTGIGEIYFGPPIYGEYQVLDLKDGEAWIVDQGAYVCSDGSVEVGVSRNKAFSALFGGEGWFQTTVKGPGKVVIQAPGPLEAIDLRGETLSVDGRFAVARTGEIRFEVRKATKSLFGSLTSGEGLLNVFQGHGRVLIAPVPNLYHNLIHSVIAHIPSGK